MTEKSVAQQIEDGIKTLDAAQNRGNQKDICLAHAVLGSAYFLDRDLANGRKQFEAGDQLVEELEDQILEIDYLKIKSFAQHLAQHLPDAYKGAERLFIIGKETDDPGLMSDALASQGQIQLDSADPVKANELLQQALDIATDMDDPRRIMSIHGALGNLSMAIAATDNALKDFYQARFLAEELNEEPLIIGFTGSIGTLLSFQGKHSQAIQEFEKILEYVKGQDDVKSQIQAIRYLCKSHSGMGNYPEAARYAREGIELSAQTDKETTIFFYEKLVISLYKMNDLHTARELTEKAVRLAGTLKDKRKQVELLIGLGESFAISELYEQALEIYRKALDLSTQVEQFKNEAYLVGRIGVVLAEMGRIDEAIEQHQKAVLLAKDRALPDLEAQQLTMLAMAHFDNKDISSSLEFATRALDAYQEADLLDESEKVRTLIKEIKAAQ